MIRESYTSLIGREQEILTNAEVLDIEGNNLLAHTGTDSYNGVYGGYQAYKVLKQDTEYLVHLDGDEAKVVVYTDRGDISILVKPENPYESPVWVKTVLATANVELEVIKAFNTYAQSAFSYGGPAPYIEILEGTLAELTEAVVDPDPVV